MVFSLKNPKNVSWGQNAKSGLILKKMAFGLHLRGQMLNVMAKKSTDTNFKYKEWCYMGFSSKNKKMFPGDKMPKMALY